MRLPKGCYWIVVDKGFHKKGQHPVGVARRYGGQFGKQHNCQVTVNLSQASARGNLPIAFWLYSPIEWASGRSRRKKAGVPGDITIATTAQIALEQIRAAKAAGVPVGVLLVDAGYGNGLEFHEGL